METRPLAKETTELFALAEDRRASAHRALRLQLDTHAAGRPRGLGQKDTGHVVVTEAVIYVCGDADGLRVVLGQDVSE